MSCYDRGCLPLLDDFQASGEMGVFDMQQLAPRFLSSTTNCGVALSHDLLLSAHLLSRMMEVGVA